MRLFLLFIPLVLTGCLTNAPVPIKQSWPDIPKEMLEACPNLKLVDPNTTKLSDIIEVVSDNYSTYYDCKAKVDDWIMWYQGQKKIFEDTK